MLKRKECKEYWEGSVEQFIYDWTKELSSRNNKEYPLTKMESYRMVMFDFGNAESNVKKINNNKKA